MASLKHAFSALGSLALNAVFPPRCPSCHTQVAVDGNFCASCFAQVKLIAPPFCACCGIPFVATMGEGALCPECLVEPPEFAAARAVMVYDRISAPLITSLKFHDQWSGVTRYGEMMRAASDGLLARSDMVVPVPLHWQRLLKRRYNQAAVLAYRLAEAAGLPCRLDILKRVRSAPPQMRLDRATRLKNVRKVFALNERSMADVKNKTILLIDDVVTTGATVNACAKLLKKAGAKEVNVLALARTVKE